MEINDDNNLNQPLLADDEQEQLIDTITKSDDALSSQLVLASGASTDREHATTLPRCGRCVAYCFTSFSRNRWLIGIILFSFLTWASFILSLYSTYSCDIILIDWNRNSLNLSVSGVGIFRFQQRTRNDQRNRNEIHCVEYASFKTNAGIRNIEEFFTVDRDLRVLSILAPTLHPTVSISPSLRNFGCIRTVCAHPNK